MKITDTTLRFQNLNFCSSFLAIAELFSKFNISYKDLVPVKIQNALYLAVLMGVTGLTTAQTPKKDKSPTLVIEYVAFIDLLQDGEHYDIEMTHAGCFNQSAETLSITKRGNEYIAQLNSQERNLNDTHIDILRNFENNLRYISSGGCTTTETYILRYKSKKLIFSDDSCAHWFAKHLKENLGFTM